MIRILLFLSLVTSSWAFMPNPDLLTITPAVARAGETVTVTIAGKNLDETRSLRFTHPEITVELARKAPDAIFPEGQQIPNTFNVTIPAEIEPGVYEVRSLGFFGLSTARPFLIVEEDAVEITETTPHGSQETAMPIEMNSGVTGHMAVKQIDWFRFEGKAGERILAQVWAERLDSHADAQLSIYNEGGKELQSSQHHFGRDPLVDLLLPTDGTYFLAVSDVLFRNRGKEYFYRIELTNTAHLDFAFPPAGLPGTETRFTFHGRNLPGGSLGEGLSWKGHPLETVEETVSVPEIPSSLSGIFPGLPRQGIVPAFEHRIAESNPVRIGFATAPVIHEERTVNGQSISLPCEIAGRFDEPGDEDSFRFSAKAGQTWWVEVISERLGALTDPWIQISKINEDGTKTPVVENDEPPSYFGPDTFDDLNVDTLDPALSFTAKEDGNFEVVLVNRSAGGSIAHLYRLAIREAQPDFQLVTGTELTKTINNDAYPMAPLLRPGGSMVYRVLAFRQDGFEGDITVSAEGLPVGVTAPPLIMTGATREGYLTLQAEADVKPWHGPIRLVGRSGDLTRQARSASIIWGVRVFASQRQVRSRLDEEIVLSVISSQSETEPCRLSAAEDKVWEVALKEKLEIPIRVMDFGNRTGNLQVEAFGFPGLLRSPPKVTIPEGKSEGTLTFDFTPTGSFKPLPGRHQFVLQGVGNAKYLQNPEAVATAEAEAKRVAGLENSGSAKKAADKAVQAATALAKERTSQFATYSLPVTVVVSEAK